VFLKILSLGISSHTCRLASFLDFVKIYD